MAAASRFDDATIEGAVRSVLATADATPPTDEAVTTAAAVYKATDAWLRRQEAIKKEAIENVAHADGMRTATVKAAEHGLPFWPTVVIMDCTDAQHGCKGANDGGCEHDVILLDVDTDQKEKVTLGGSAVAQLLFDLRQFIGIHFQRFLTGPQRVLASHFYGATPAYVHAADDGGLTCRDRNGRELGFECDDGTCFHNVVLVMSDGGRRERLIATEALAVLIATTPYKVGTVGRGTLPDVTADVIDHAVDDPPLVEFVGHFAALLMGAMQFRPSVVVNKASYGQSAAGTRHLGVTCDTCLASNPRGTVWCCTLCRGFYVCFDCKADGNAHDPLQHPMFEIPKPLPPQLHWRLNRFNLGSDDLDNVPPFRWSADSPLPDDDDATAVYEEPEAERTDPSVGCDEVPPLEETSVEES
jgi:hypothetical protein